MNITVESYGPAVVLNLKGEFTIDSIEAFRKAVEHELSNATVRDFVLNLESVPFIDSAAMECLLELQQQLVDRLGQVKLVAPDENVRKILEITRLDACFESYAQANEAVKTA